MDARLRGKGRLSFLYSDRADLLQVLWCPFDHVPHQSWPSVYLFWRESGTYAGAATQPPGSTVTGFKEYVPRPCTLAPEPVTDYPDYDLLPAGLRAQVETWEDDENSNAYRANAVVPGWKTGGWGISWGLFEAFDIRCDCGAPAVPLLTVAMTEWASDTAAHWMPIEEQHLLGTRDHHRADIGITIGRGYDLHMFHCATDPVHAPVTVMV